MVLHIEVTLHAVLEEIYATGEVTTPDGTVIDTRLGQTEPMVARCLERLVQESPSSQSLEIGMAYGISTVAMLAGHASGQAGRHHVIDPFQQSYFKGAGLHTVDRAGLAKRMVFWPERSQMVLPRMVDQGLEFGVVFHDGSHLYDELTTDLFFIDRLLPVGGILAIDDLWMPAIRRAVSFMLANLGYEAVDMKTGSPSLRRLITPFVRFARDPRLATAWPVLKTADRVLFLRKTAQPQRAWDHFKPF